MIISNIKTRAIRQRDDTKVAKCLMIRTKALVNNFLKLSDGEDAS
jgi:hypothetical protein